MSAKVSDLSIKPTVLLIIERVATNKCSLAKFRLPIVPLVLILSLILTFLYKLSMRISILTNRRFLCYLLPDPLSKKSKMARGNTVEIDVSVARNFNKDSEKSIPLFFCAYSFS